MAFASRYSLQNELGRGNYSIVYLCTSVEDQSEYAVKHVSKASTTSKDLSDVLQEVKIMEKLKGHEYIGSIVESFDEMEDLFIIMELLRGGPLFNQIVKRKRYSEKDAAQVTHHVLEALQFMHNHNICHRDLKPENIMLRDEQDLAAVKLVDFGFAAECPKGESKLSKCCGTPLYIAPEILNHSLFQTGGEYGTQCDMWSLGVIVYILLCGYPPIRQKAKAAQFKAVVRGEYTFNEKYWSPISEHAIDFIQKLLVLNPETRLNADGALQHTWMLNARDDDLPETVTNLKEFNATRQWRKGIFGIEAITRLRYVAICMDHQIKPNSEVLKLVQDMSSLKVLDLGRNYLAPAGLNALFDWLLDDENDRANEVEELRIGKNGLNNGLVEKLCKVLRKRKNVHTVDLSDNNISFNAGRQLLHTVQMNEKLLYMQITGTKIQPQMQARIEDQLKRNRGRAGKE